jgi:fatty acyl-CoA reductase
VFSSFVPSDSPRQFLVIPSYKEPVNNWIDSFGALGLLAFVSLGIARVVPSRLGPIVDLVPVDLVASALIATAWDIPTKDGIPIYNYVSSIDNPITFQDFIASFKTQLPR